MSINLPKIEETFASNEEGQTEKRMQNKNKKQNKEENLKLKNKKKTID